MSFAVFTALNKTKCLFLYFSFPILLHYSLHLTQVCHWDLIQNFSLKDGDSAADLGSRVDTNSWLIGIIMETIGDWPMQGFLFFLFCG